MSGFDVTQHFLGPIAQTNNDEYECNVRGYHRLSTPERKENLWMVAGWYTIKTEGPRISAITLHVSYQEGDPSLTELAMAKAKS